MVALRMDKVAKSPNDLLKWIKDSTQGFIWSTLEAAG
jgi:hypothetical protein